MKKLLSALAAGCLHVCVCANDYVTVTDIRSIDTIGLAKKKKASCIYENGKLMKFDRSAFKTPGRRIKRYCRVLDSARLLSAKAAEIIDTLQRSKNWFVISDSIYSVFYSYNDNAAQALVLKGDSTGRGSGGRICINLDAYVEVWNDIHKRTDLLKSPIGNLMHEMGHAWFANKGRRNTSETPDTLRIDEWRVCEIENIIRNQIGLFYREYYQVKDSVKVRVLDDKNIPRNPYSTDKNNTPGSSKSPPNHVAILFSFKRKYLLSCVPSHQVAV